MPRPPFVYALLTLALLALSPAAMAGSNRKGSWSTHETRHFQVVYHQEVKAQADFARDFLEEAYASMTGLLELPDRGIRITVVITGWPDEANGMATPLGHEIIIFARPAQVIAANDAAWLRRVLAHELAHQITFLALRNVFGIYGELYKAFHLPIWFTEGLAQYLGETWDAKRNTFFAHALYNSALEAYPAMAAFTRTNPLASRLVYEQGHAFVRYLAARHGGPAFLGRLLRKLTFVPIYTEVKALLSPMTARYLPLEVAILALTGENIGFHYNRFLSGMAKGLPKAAAPPQAPLADAPGLDVVLYAKQRGPGEFVVAAQARWDEPTISLFRVKDGRAENLGPDFVNPVFDLSADGRLLAYVKQFTDADGEPVNRLVVRDLGSGREAAVADGAYHPAFLGADTVAFARWKSGRQVLSLCPALAGGRGCREEAPDSLAGFFALSRSRAGLLMNATDAAGRTGIHEYVPGSGFRRIFQDTVVSEFPVEAADGAIWMIREAHGLMQVSALDSSGTLSPVAGFPLGAFFLHRVAPGRIAAVAQSGPAGPWRLAPVEIASPGPDTAGLASIDSAAGTARTGGPADSGAMASVPAPAVDSGSGPWPDSLARLAYRAPKSLVAPARFPGTVAPSSTPAGRPYRSLLKIRPLLIWPFLAPAYPFAGVGGGALLQDPLGLHTLSGGLAFRPEGDPLYDVTYVNAQSPLSVSLFSSNGAFDVDTIANPPAGWESLDVVNQITVADLALSAAPFTLPRPHNVYLGAGAGRQWELERLAGVTTADSGDSPSFTGWSRASDGFYHRLFLGYYYALPYAYFLAHPLRETSLFLQHRHSYAGDGDALHFYGLHVFPLRQELTLTTLYQGSWYHGEFRPSLYPMPDGSSVLFYRLRERGLSQFAYLSLDLPVFKGYLYEIPLFGVCNFVGLGAYGAYGRDSFEKSPYADRPGLEDEDAVGGIRVFALTHMMRKLPFVWSVSAQYDFVDQAMEYGLGVGVGGVLPQAAWSRPDGPRKPGLSRKP